MMSSDFIHLCLLPDTPIMKAADRINKGRRGIVLVVDDQRRLLGTVVDGDIRRALLAGRSMDGPLSDILEHKRQNQLLAPVTERLGSGRAQLLRLMQKHSVRQIPLLDEDGRVAGLVTLSDLMPEETEPFQAVIMAGGMGTRLAPLTGDCPKPLLPVGDRPLLEHIIAQLKQAGIKRVSLSTYYLADKIREHFGDGTKMGVDLAYVTEDRPLGTAGALGLLETPNETILVINGDILTSVDFKAMLDFHHEQDAVATIGVRKFDMDVPYGVVEGEGGFVNELKEKPILSFFVNAGIYLLEPSVFRLLRPRHRLDMTELIQALLAEGERVASFPIIEYWLDIGHHHDYLRAQEDVKNGKV
jgi:dTDP-glucose pyrophosphorylase